MKVPFGMLVRRVSMRPKLEHWEVDLDMLEVQVVAMLRRAATLTRRKMDTSRGVIVGVRVHESRYYAEIFPTGFTMMKEKHEPKTT